MSLAVTCVNQIHEVLWCVLLSMQVMTVTNLGGMDFFSEFDAGACMI